jgi:predicted anti-sigma-YlaC factor YlaD
VINCKDFMVEIGNYLDGEVAAEVRAQIEGHLAHCQTCQVVYDSARKTVKVLTDCGSFDLPEAISKPIAEQVMAKIRTSGKSL